jgi:hypothetical protein
MGWRERKLRGLSQSASSRPEKSQAALLAGLKDELQQEGIQVDQTAMSDPDAQLASLRQQLEGQKDDETKRTDEEQQQTFGQKTHMQEEERHKNPNLDVLPDDVLEQSKQEEAEKSQDERQSEPG